MEYETWRDEKIRALTAKETYDFEDLRDVVTILRGVGGCPWDREQDHHSIRRGMIEECYEVVEAIDREDPVLLREELGDVLLQVLFHADMERDAGRFTFDDVAGDECAKMIHRHPHVFGTVKADTSAQVLENWEAIKTQEKQRVTLADKLNAIPPMLPALLRADKVGKKTESDAALSDAEMICALHENLDAFANAEGREEQARAMGELLFRLTGLCRRADIDGEEALSAETDRVIRRTVGEKC